MGVQERLKSCTGPKRVPSRAYVRWSGSMEEKTDVVGAEEWEWRGWGGKRGQSFELVLLKTGQKIATGTGGRI